MTLAAGKLELIPIEADPLSILKFFCDSLVNVQSDDDTQTRWGVLGELNQDAPDVPSDLTNQVTTNISTLIATARNSCISFMKTI